jgi:hypothetical protein
VPRPANPPPTTAMRLGGSGCNVHVSSSNAKWTVINLVAHEHAQAESSRSHLIVFDVVVI